jgi:deoxyribodipyrimidine photo-lyase|tara:strand:- start:2081 stop:3226 length:1146 start_codon:yes stop_codon:yes gene_type:complete
MNFEPSREFAIKKLEDFIDKNLHEYSKLRNFDFGPEQRKNVSSISPYITHGILSETEVIKNSLKKFSFAKNEKFVQEVLWRIYWKGWLELRPMVWSDYIVELKKLKKDFYNNKNYLNAIEGKTNIECFNYWISEIKKYNYLHNHARMWFASIWIFTLNLPWQLGAEFFMKYLLDGDSASNTLGWRWVAGVQTKGKNYIASEWNIKKFTNNRFSQIKLNENPQPIIDNKNYSILKNDFLNNEINKNDNLIVFENSLSIECSDFKEFDFKNVYLVQKDNDTREIKLDEKVLKFKEDLISDQKIRLENKSSKIEIINVKDLKNLDGNNIALYPSIGEINDFLISNNLKNIKYLYRKIDQYAWKYCNKGFFNFKNYIPKIVTEFI